MWESSGNEGESLHKKKKARRQEEQHVVERRDNISSSSLMMDLPHDCLGRALDYLTVKDIFRVRQTCQWLRKHHPKEVFRSIELSGSFLLCATMCKGEPKVLENLLQNPTVAAKYYDDESSGDAWLDKLLRALIKNDDGPSVSRLLQSGEDCEDFGVLEFAHGDLHFEMEDYILYAEQCEEEEEEEQQVTSAMAALRENELVMECTQFCELCNYKVGTLDCRWDGHPQSCSAYSETVDAARRCRACEQRRDYCGVCCNFECQACRNDLQPSDNYIPVKCVWRECGDCGKRVCRSECDHKTCYLECSRCDTVKCEPCDEKSGNVFRHYCHACFVNSRDPLSYDGFICDACKDQPCTVCQEDLRVMHHYCTDEVRESYDLACRRVGCNCLYIVGIAISGSTL